MQISEIRYGASYMNAEEFTPGRGGRRISSLKLASLRRKRFPGGGTTGACCTRDCDKILDFTTDCSWMGTGDEELGARRWVAIQIGAAESVCGNIDNMLSKFTG